jgi:hypothetical protein
MIRDQIIQIKPGWSVRHIFIQNINASFTLCAKILITLLLVGILSVALDKTN